MESICESIDSSLLSDGIGSKLMKKHGWHEGQGLGKKMQGRADPLEVCSFENKWIKRTYTIHIPFRLKHDKEDLVLVLNKDLNIKLNQEILIKM